MHAHDVIAELAQMHRRVQALLSCIARLHQESATQRQHIEDVTESRAYLRQEEASETQNGQRCE